MNKLMIHPNFRQTLSDVRKVSLTLVQAPSNSPVDFGTWSPQRGVPIRPIERIISADLDAKRGESLARDLVIGAYDESKLRFLALEGSAFFTTHSLIVADHMEYLPASYLTFYFYTRSRNISGEKGTLKQSEDPEADSNRDYVVDRTQFILDWSTGDVLFIDGPLIGGNMTSYTVRLVEALHKRNIIPVFIVKNSDSNMVTDSFPELRNKYHSDLHWAYRTLSRGQRSGMVQYVDQDNPKNSKVFCYVKSLNVSPMRVEMHSDTYSMAQHDVPKLMDLIHYLVLVQGSYENPQIRPVAVAEMYARSVLRLIDPYTLVRSSGLTPTMNQERFGG